MIFLIYNFILTVYKFLNFIKNLNKSFFFTTIFNLVFLKLIFPKPYSKLSDWFRNHRLRRIRRVRSILSASFIIKKWKEIFLVHFYTPNLENSNWNLKRPNYNLIYNYRRHKYVLYTELFIIEDYLADIETFGSPIKHNLTLKYTTIKYIRTLFLKHPKLIKILNNTVKNNLKLGRLDLYSLLSFHFIFCFFFTKFDYINYNLYHQNKSINYKNSNQLENHIMLTPQYYKFFFRTVSFSKNSILNDNFWLNLKNTSLTFSKNIESLTNLLKTFNLTRIKKSKLHEEFIKLLMRRASLTLYLKFIRKHVFLKDFYPKIKTVDTFFDIQSLVNYVLNWRNIKINKIFKQVTLNFWPLRYKTNNLTKIATQTNSEVTENNYKLFFIRKNRIFNKSRYSRNRQLYRTGFYWCLWLSIFLGFSFLFLFYRFTINFGYIWWLGYFGLSLGVFNKAIKYHLYNIFIVFKELKAIWCWVLWFFNKTCNQTHLLILKFLHLLLSFFNSMSKYNILFVYLTRFLKQTLKIYLIIYDFYLATKLYPLEEKIGKIIVLIITTLYKIYLKFWKKIKSIIIFVIITIYNFIINLKFVQKILNTKTVRWFQTTILWDFLVYVSKMEASDYKRIQDHIHIGRRYWKKHQRNEKKK